MAGSISIQAIGDVSEIQAPLDMLSGSRTRRALSLALNHTLAKVETQVSRALVRQTGLKYRQVKMALKRYSANSSRLEGRILGRGDYLPLKEFGARQAKGGVSAAPWGKRRLFPGTFVIAAYGGGVFKRKTGARFPIKKLYGPAVPKEMVKGQTKDAFHKAVAHDLPRRVDYELARLLST